MNALTYYNQARRAIQKATAIDEVKEVRDKAEALRIYAKQAGEALEMQNQCAEIWLRAERRIRELLAETVRPGNPQLSQRATIRLDELGISRSQSSRWQLTAALPDDQFERYVSTANELTTASVIRLEKEHQQVVRRAESIGPKSGGHILTGPASRLWDRLDDESIDMFFSDPPYADMDRYAELAELAAAKLKPSRLCLAYTGIMGVPEVLDVMREHLTYHWLFAIRFAGQRRLVRSRSIQNTWVAVVVFSKGVARRRWIVDHLESGGAEKDLHDHQKSQPDDEYIISKLTRPGDLIVDPFCGSGTIPAACQATGRRWLACEINSTTARIARGRVAA